MTGTPSTSASGRLRAAFLLLIFFVAGLWLLLSYVDRDGNPSFVVRQQRQATGDQRTTTAARSVSVPDDFPSDLPLYPDAQVVRVDQRTRRSAYTAELVIAEDINIVRSQYERILRQNAWAVQSTRSESSVQIVIRKGSRTGTILLQTDDSDDSPSTRMTVTTLPVPPESGEPSS